MIYLFLGYFFFSFFAQRVKRKRSNKSKEINLITTKLIRFWTSQKSTFALLKWFFRLFRMTCFYNLTVSIIILMGNKNHNTNQPNQQRPLSQLPLLPVGRRLGWGWIICKGAHWHHYQQQELICIYFFHNWYIYLNIKFTCWIMYCIVC